MTLFNLSQPTEDPTLLIGSELYREVACEGRTVKPGCSSNPFQHWCPNESPGTSEIGCRRWHSGTCGGRDPRLRRGLQRHAYSDPYSFARRFVLAAHGHPARGHFRPGKPLLRSLFRELSWRSWILRPKCGVSAIRCCEYDQCAVGFSASISPRYDNNERRMYARHHA